MWAILYRFELYPEKEELFIQTWKETTISIKELAGTHGSRLHRLDNGNFMAYALWPSRDHFDKRRDLLDENPIDGWQAMRSCCKAVEVVYKMEVVLDLLD